MNKDDSVLSSTYPVDESVSKLNRSGSDVQSCHPFVEQLTIFHIWTHSLAWCRLLSSESLTSNSIKMTS